MNKLIIPIATIAGIIVGAILAISRYRREKK